MKRLVLLIALIAWLTLPAVCFSQAPEEAVVYKNEGLGITLRGPAGWCLYEGIRKHPDILAIFSRLPYTVGQDNPKVILMKQKRAKKGPDSPQALAGRELEVLELMKNLKEVTGTRVIEGPQPLSAGALEGVQFTYEIGRQRKKQLEQTTASEYIFFRDGVFYILLCGSRSDVFEKYRADFRAAADSFTIQ